MLGKGMFLPTTNLGLGYDFEPMSLISVRYFAEFKNTLFRI